MTGPERRKRDWVTILSILGPMLVLGWTIIREETKIVVQVAEFQSFFDRLEDHLCAVEAKVEIRSAQSCHEDFHPKEHP